MDIFKGRFWFVCMAAAAFVFIVSGTEPPPPGHFHPIPSNDPTLQSCANFAAAHFNRLLNIAYCQTLVAVANASEAVVNGAVFEFSIEMQESDKCLIQKCYVNVSSTDCPPNPQAKPYWCDAKVLARPWTPTPYVIEELKCRPPDL